MSELTYVAEKPCKYGHEPIRYRSGGACVVCMKTRAKAHKAANREKVRAAERAQYAKNLEAERQRSRKYYRDNTEARKNVSKKWAKENQGAARLIQARHYKKAGEGRRQGCANWRKENRKKVSEYNKRYLEENREAVYCIRRRREARLRGNGGSHTKEDIEGLYACQRGRCVYCRVSLRGGFHVDHRTPLALGGSNDRKNLQLLCAPCNLAKQAVHPVVFAQRRGLLL